MGRFTNGNGIDLGLWNPRRNREGIISPQASGPGGDCVHDSGRVSRSDHSHYTANDPAI